MEKQTMNELSILILLNVLILVSSTKSGRIAHWRIDDGEDPAEIAKYPYIVSIQIPKEDRLIHSCSGSIIADNWILSAAHCETQIEGTIVRVHRTGAAPRGIKAKILEIISHQDFNTKNYDNDIALLKLDRPITGAKGGRIISLPRQDQAVEAEEVVNVLEWGTAETCSRESFEILEIVEVEIVDYANCNSQCGSGNRITKNMICASRLDKGVCEMDSGGPLVSNNKELVGVVSRDTGCANENHPGIYTKVSQYRNWIRENSGV